MTRSHSNWFVRGRLKTRQLMLLAAMEEEGNVRRAIDFHEGDKIDEEALKTLIRAAVTLNRSKARK